MDVILYTSPTCGYCKMVKEYLSQKGVSFEERDVSKNSNYAQELVNNTGQMGVPVTIIDGQKVIGYDRARLDRILNQKQTGQRPSFGAFIADAGKITAKQSQGTTVGAYVGKVRTGSIAERIGLIPGDIITEVNMRRIANASDLEDVLNGLKKDSRFSVILLRGNETINTQGVF